MNEIYKDLDKLYEKIEKIENENKRLHCIIKEVREYIEKNYDDYEEFIYGKEFKEKVLEILDKEGNSNE